MAGQLLEKGGLFTGLLIDDSAAAAGANSLTSLAAGSAALTGTTNFNGSPAAKPTSIDNSSLNGRRVTLNVSLVFATAPAAGGTVDIYALYAVDGSTYGGGTSGASPTTVSAHYLGSMNLVNAVTQPVTTLVKRILPYKCQFQIVNNGSTALGAQNAGSKIYADLSADQYT